MQFFFAVLLFFMFPCGIPITCVSAAIGVYMALVLCPLSQARKLYISAPVQSPCLAFPLVELHCIRVAYGVTFFQYCICIHSAAIGWWASTL